MIVCPQPAAAEAGLSVMRAGGNAVDAAVTAAFVQGVVDPHMCGIGGCGVMAIYTAATRSTEVIEFYARAGSLARPAQWAPIFIRESSDGYGYVVEGSVNEVGYQSVGVPGTVRGLARALERRGTIPWAEAISPAARIAREGVVVSAEMHRHWTEDAGPDHVAGEARLRATPASARIFLADGRLPRIGERLDFSTLAETLEHLAAAGASDFYEGEIAEAIARDFEVNDGLITAEDLANYSARIVDPLQGSYRDLELLCAPPPGGGATLLQMLNHLEGSAAAASDFVRAMAFAVADRDTLLGDPRFSDIAVSGLIDKRYAAAARHDSPTTTQVCTLDGDGNAVSLTHTLGAWSGVVTPKLGFNYNNYMNCFDPRPGRPNSIEAGKTRMSMMCPTLGLSAGELRLVIGAPGATRIVTALLHTISNLVDRGMSAFEAVAAPRFDFQGRQIVLEGRVTSDTAAELSRLGWPMVRRAINYDAYFGEPQLIWISDRKITGASDPRGDGGVALS